MLKESEVVKCYSNKARTLQYCILVKENRLATRGEVIELKRIYEEVN